MMVNPQFSPCMLKSQLDSLLLGTTYLSRSVNGCQMYLHLQCFSTVDETGIPKLRAFVKDLTLVRRLQATEKLISRLTQSVCDMQAYLTDSGTKVRIHIHGFHQDWKDIFQSGNFTQNACIVPENKGSGKLKNLGEMKMFIGSLFTNIF